MQESNQQLNANHFDDKPIGKGQNIPQLSEYPPDFDPNDINMQTKTQPLPLNKRIQSKIWKVRKQAFQQLLNQVIEDFHAYGEFQSQSVKLIVDPNTMCQEKILKILKIFLEKSNSFSSEPKPLVKALIQKCLVIEKNDISNISTEIMFWFMDKYPQILINQVNEGTLHKNPKICSSSLTFLEKLVHEYGVKKLNNLQMFKKNFTILGSGVRPVAKAQVLSLFKEVFKWMGENTMSFGMHKEVQEELQKFSKNYAKEEMVIKRGLNSEKLKIAQNTIQKDQVDDEDLPEVDVLGHYDSRWVDKVLQIQKWKQKKQELEKFIRKIDTPKILPRDNTQYISLIKRLLSDNNINILLCGFKIVRCLCKGLKKNFSHPCRVIQGIVYAKLKDSKHSIVEQAHQTLKFMLYSVAIQDLIEEIKEGLKDKAANMRLQSLKFLKNYKISKDKKTGNTLKSLIPTIVQLSQDGSLQVRETALEILCKLKGFYGMSFFGDRLRNLPTKKLEAIQKYIDPNNPENNSKVDKIENSDMDIEEEILHHRQKENKIQKQIPLNKSKFQQASNLPHQNFQHKGFNRIHDLESTIQNTRYNAYQHLLAKQSQVIQTQLFESFKQKAPLIRQSSAHVLKTLLNLVKKATNIVNLQHIQFLLYHDWKKCKHLLSDFIQSSKLSLPALELVKSSANLFTSNVGSKKDVSDSNSPLTMKSFLSSLHSLIPKMSNPNQNVRLQAADSAIQLIKTLPQVLTGQTEHQNSEILLQFYNVLKCRIQDFNEQITNKYIQVVSELLIKGFIAKHKGSGKHIISLLIKKIGDYERLPNLEFFISEMVKNHSQIFWQYLSTQIIKESLCLPILNIINKQNEYFFKFADQKSYILPLLTCMSENIEVQKVEELLNQIVQINGEKFLQKNLKQCNLPNLENYAKKWNINLEAKSSSQAKNEILSSGSTYCLSKNDRINSQIENPWPLSPSPNHIIKLMGTLLSFGEPFSNLSVPINLSVKEFQIIEGLTPDFLQEYSDLLVKWIFWRIHMENSPQSMICLCNLTKRLLQSGFELHESEIVIILGALSGCLIYHKKNYIDFVCEINSVMNASVYKEKAFRYWINSFNDADAPIDEILHVMIKSCADMIPSEMVVLARFPAVVKNYQFNEYLRANFSEKLLTVYGFKMPDLKKKSAKAKSETIFLDNLQESQAKYFKEFFQKSSSNEVIEKIVKHTDNIPEDYVIETHLKIMNSIILPYLHRELSFINVYNYFKYLQNNITTFNCEPFLLNLIRTLAFFLIDLDEIKLQNNSQMLKTINKIILLLLEMSQPKHILEVLFVMLREQLKGKQNSKLNLLLPKCIIKVIKNPSFRTQYERNQQVFDWLKYVICESKEIICIFELALESPITKTFKSLLQDIISMYPQTSSVFGQILNTTNLNSVCAILFTDIFQEKGKVNNAVGFRAGTENKVLAEVISTMNSNLVEKKNLNE